MTVKSFFNPHSNPILFSTPPQRIISLVPSQTELLFDLGLNREVVGITKFCVHPGHWRNEKRIIGGTKKFHFEVIDYLQPDLILGNKEENYKEGIEKLSEKYPVWVSDIVSMADAEFMIRQIGDLTGKQNIAETIINKITISFSALKSRPSRRVLYMIWRKPWMAAGFQTFIHTLLTQVGLENCVKDDRYPELSEEQIKKLNPDLIFLSSEPYPFLERHKQELLRIVPSAKIMLVDGEMFSWYGSRLIKAPAYFNSLDID